MSSRSALPTLVAVLILAAAIIGGAVLLLAAQPAPVTITINPPPATSTPAPSPTPAPVTVYITGAVNQPDSLVTLPSGSRIKDALDAVGGASANADLERIDLAALLQDGDHIHVYQVGESQQISDDSQSSASNSQPDVVHINHATLEQLETLPGISPALAQRILDYRTANGPFASLDDLTAVSGIGASIVQKLTGLVAFD